jgi:hypothetical protein
MSMKNTFLALAILSGSLLAGTQTASAATYTYVGSWAVHDPAAPTWFGTPPNGPIAYTGQEAAALLFGGSASDYAISTIDNQVANINNRAWYDVIGVGGSIFAENYSNKYLGIFYGPTVGYNCCGTAFLLTNPASAFVRDNFMAGTNYAFRVSAVPIPPALALFATGIMGAYSMTRRRKRKTG